MESGLIMDKLQPVAWAFMLDGDFWDAIHPDEHAQEEGSYTIPLYTHPVSQYKAITNTKIYPTVVSYTHPVKELTDEEIEELWYDPRFIGDPVAFGKAVLREAKSIPLQTDEEICKKCDALTERAILRKAQE